MDDQNECEDSDPRLGFCLFFFFFNFIYGGMGLLVLFNLEYVFVAGSWCFYC
jgi:hypothetical protein